MYPIFHGIKTDNELKLKISKHEKVFNNFNGNR